MMYMIAVRDAVGGTPDQVLENIAKYAYSPSTFQGVLLARLNSQRDDFLRQVKELVQFAQMNDPTPSFECKPMLAVFKVKNASGRRRKSSRESKNLVLVFNAETKDTTSMTVQATRRRFLRWALLMGLTSRPNGFLTPGRVVIW